LTSRQIVPYLFELPMEIAMHRAAGTFQIRMTPAEARPDAEPDAPGRMLIEKHYSGGLEGSGEGEMLAMMIAQSGAYVAMERIRGNLDGHDGAFTVVHRGIMDAGRHELSITIVPGSGAGALEGISGVYYLSIENGVHSYVLEYRLPGDHQGSV
jgi:hypothetical protein